MHRGVALTASSLPDIIVRVSEWALPPDDAECQKKMTELVRSCNNFE